MRKRRLTPSLILIWLMLFSVATASARRLMQGDMCRIDADETVEQVVFVLCQQLEINGTLDGILIGAATNTVINGEVTGGIYLTGLQMDIFGNIHDDVHYAGTVLNLAPTLDADNTDTDIFAVTMSTYLAPDATLPGSITGAGYQMILEGDVGREINFWGSTLEIGGSVGGDVHADVGDSTEFEGTAQLETLFLPLPVELDLKNPGLRIAESATINRDLYYTALSPGEIAGAVEGETIFEDLSANQTQLILNDEGTWRRGLQSYAVTAMREFVTLGVVGALGLMFAPNLTQAPIQNLRRRPLTSLGVGTLTFILSFPMVVIALFISVLLIFVLSLLQAGNLVIAGTVVLMVVDLGGASVFYFVAIFVARSIVSLAIGRRLLRFVFEDDGEPRFLYLSLGVGALAIGFAVSLPVIGWILNALTLFLGLGAIVNVIQAQIRHIRENSGLYTHAPDYPEDASEPDIEVAPPALPAQAPNRPPKQNRPSHTIGTDNLPEGFVWWDEL